MYDIRYLQKNPGILAQDIWHLLQAICVTEYQICYPIINYCSSPRFIIIIIIVFFCLYYFVYFHFCVPAHSNCILGRHTYYNLLCLYRVYVQCTI